MLHSQEKILWNFYQNGCKRPGDSGADIFVGVLLPFLMSSTYNGRKDDSQEGGWTWTEAIK